MQGCVTTQQSNLSRPDRVDFHRVRDRIQCRVEQPDHKKGLSDPNLQKLHFNIYTMHAIWRLTLSRPRANHNTPARLRFMCNRGLDWPKNLTPNELGSGLDCLLGSRGNGFMTPYFTQVLKS